jgi:SAM-dependent methyltransferase
MLTCRTDQNGLACPCCLATQISGLEAWHHVCLACGYESAQLSPAINTTGAGLCESLRADGLRALRQDNFRELLDQIGPHLSHQQQTLLEVGCGHGWFLEIAAARFSVTGIEPDEQIFLHAKARGANVIRGYFPEALVPATQFDVIVFNDVLEHLANADAALRACRGALNPGGLLVLNIPTSKGIFYRMTKVVKRLGFGGAFERMWQKDFPSPHLHYFSQSNLEMLLLRCGFEVKFKGTLPSVRLKGLYSRIAYAKPASQVQSALIWLVLAVFYPLIRHLPSDAMLVFAMPPGSTPAS